MLSKLEKVQRLRICLIKPHSIPALGTSWKLLTSILDHLVLTEQQRDLSLFLGLKVWSQVILELGSDTAWPLPQGHDAYLLMDSR